MTPLFHLKSCVVCFVCENISMPLIDCKKECYIIEEVIEVDELDKGNISATLGNQDK